jgi:3-oxoacyl-[acyl-carrier protein] reductase
VKLAVVTGASRGVGRALALELGKRGFELALLGRESAAQEETNRHLREQGIPFRHIACELAAGASVERAARTVLEAGRAPDVLVNNAGIIERAPVAECSDEVWQRQLDVNLTAPFRLTRAFLPAMLARKQGRILHVASISAVLGTKTQSAYHASKWGLVGFMKCLAEELTDTGLMTCALLPGSIDTDMLAGSGYPPRMTAEDVARTLCFYAEDAPLAHNGAIVEMFGT